MPHLLRVEMPVMHRGISSVLGVLQAKPAQTPHVNRGETFFGRVFDWGRDGVLRGYLWNGRASQVARRDSARLSLHKALPFGADASLSSTAASSSKAVAPRNGVYIRVSASFLRRLANQSLDERGPVVDEILGTTVEGTSHTTARTELALLPDAQRARTVLRVFGTTTFDVGGQRGPVDIDSQGTTEFHAEKILLLEGNKLRALPTQVNAKTRLTRAQASTRLPGLRGLVVNGFAERRLARRRSDAEHVTARHTERSVARQLDGWVDHQLGDVVTPLTDMAALVSRGSSHLPKDLRSSTTREMLEVIVLAPADGGAEMTKAPALEPGHPDVTVHFHSALVRQVLSDPQLRPLIQAFTETMLALGSSAAIVEAPPAMANIPIDSVRWSKTGEWLTLNLGVRPRLSSTQPKPGRR